MVTSMRGCVAYNDLWPWPISSRSYGLENRVRFVAFSVPDWFFLYLVQMITSMRRCVACDDLWPWPISLRSFDLVLTWDPTWLNSMGNQEAAGRYPQNKGVLVVLVSHVLNYEGSFPSASANIIKSRMVDITVIHLYIVQKLMTPFSSAYNFPDSKYPWIYIDYILVRSESFGWIFNWRQSEGLCYLGWIILNILWNISILAVLS